MHGVIVKVMEHHRHTKSTRSHYASLRISCDVNKGSAIPRPPPTRREKHWEVLGKRLLNNIITDETLSGRTNQPMLSDDQSKDPVIDDARKTDQ